MVCLDMRSVVTALSSVMRMIKISDELSASALIRGLDSDEKRAVAASSGVCGPVIPPSICLIVYGAALSMSIGDLFLASVVPGLFLGGVLCLMAYLISKKHNFL